MISNYQKRIENCLSDLLPSDDSQIAQAMRYATLDAGKRLRACLIYAIAEDFGLELSEVDYLATAVECMHAYSLIHDDLPAMDDDSLRRGKPSTHKAFGEALAILAGDALNTFAFELLANNKIDPTTKIKQIAMLAHDSGVSGMVGGQSLDILSSNHKITQQELYLIHEMKTAALLNSCLHLPVMIHEKYEEYASRLANLAKQLGLVYQMIDDVLDVTANSEILGKTAGKDLAQHKNTFPALYGLTQCQQLINEIAGNIENQLGQLPQSAKHLKIIVNYIINREY